MCLRLVHLLQLFNLAPSILFQNPRKTFWGKLTWENDITTWEESDFDIRRLIFVWQMNEKQKQIVSSSGSSFYLDYNAKKIVSEMCIGAFVFFLMDFLLFYGFYSKLLKCKFLYSLSVQFWCRLLKIFWYWIFCYSDNMKSASISKIFSIEAGNKVPFPSKYSLIFEKKTFFFIIYPFCFWKKIITSCCTFEVLKLILIYNTKCRCFSVSSRKLDTRFKQNSSKFRKQRVIIFI